MAIDNFFTKNTQAVNAIGTQMFHGENRIDCTKHTITTGDVIELIKVPAQCVITDVRIHLITVEGGAASMTIGDGDSAAAWDASVDLDATNGDWMKSAPTTDAYGNGHGYVTADTIDGTLVGTCDTAVFDIHIYGHASEATLA